MIRTGKRKRVSKKNKASWRKHVDIKDVEAFLDDQRQEERIGRFTDKKDEELFIDDCKPTKIILSEKEKRKLNARRKSKVLLMLENTSKVEDPIVKRNQVKQKRSGRNIEEEVTRPNNSRRVVQSNQDRLKFYEKLDSRQNKKLDDKIVEKDVWAEKDILDKYPEYKNDWFSKNLVEYHLRNTGNPVVKVRTSIRKKTSKLKPFEPPHPGISYNPTLKDHQELLHEVIEKESDIIKKEQHLKRVTTDMFKKVTEDERDMDILKELASSLPTEEDGVVVKEEDDENPEPYNTTNPPVQNKKKDKKARRKQREQKEILKEHQKKKQEKKKITDIHRLRHITKEVLSEQENLNEMKKRRKLIKEKKKFEPARLGKNKFEEPDISISMPEELSGDLRGLQPDHSLLADRFKSLQKRNILAPTVYKGLGKKPKRKRYVKKSHKEEPQQTKKK